MVRLLGILLFFLWLNPLLGQVTPPAMEWQKSLGGSKKDAGNDIQFTSDGGFIVLGTTLSGDADAQTIPLHGGEEVFILKFDAAREMEWRKRLGGTASDYGIKIKELAGGGYIVLGETTSPNNGDVSGVHGNPVVSVPADLWIVRLDAGGNILWQKCLGGTGVEQAGSIDMTSSGGFIISGNTTSTNGDVSGNHGSGDAWVVEINATGNILWQKCYGGTAYEGVALIKSLPAGGYVFTAATRSVNGDVTPNNPEDIWVVRIDATGNILWQQCYGGSDPETPGNIVALNDGFVVGGTTASSDWSINNLGKTDGWIFKTDLSGNLLWQETVGGMGDDRVNDIIPAADGGFFMTGGTYTAHCFNNGLEDYWLVKTDRDGKFKWEKLQGGTKEDYISAITQASNGSLYVTGASMSDDRDIIGHHNSSNPLFIPMEDMWTLIFSFTDNDMTSSVTITSSIDIICEGKPVTFKAHPVNAGNSPAFFWYVNGIEQPDYDEVFTTTTLQDGDKVWCKMISQQPCMADQEVLSNQITIRWYPNGRASGFLPPQITKCVNLYETITPARPFSAYLWSTGATTPTIRVVNPGLYWLEVTDETGCSGRENVWVANRSCMNAVYLPSAFTPNNDGLNDVFKPLVDGHLTQYKFTVYDRNGQVVFQSTDPGKGWTGIKNGIPYNTGVFVWICTYQLAGGEAKTEKGTVALIR